MPDEQGGWTVEWYVSAGGERPVRDFLSALEGRNLEEALALIELLQKWGNKLRPPRSEPLGDGLFELRGHQVRIFYIFRPGRRAVLLDGIVKKQDKIPGEVLRRVRQFQQEVEAMDAKAKRGPQSHAISAVYQAR